MQQKPNLPVRPLADGIIDSRNGALIPDGATPFAENVEFDRDSIANVGGVLKMGNRPAPPAALRTKAPKNFSPLSIQRSGESDKQSVPARGYVTIPYSKSQDIGGDFVYD